jgi:hypothetical protein
MLRMRAALAAGCAVFVVGPMSAFAQAPTYSPARTADGHPDLGGVWSNADAKVTLSRTVAGKVQTSILDEPDGVLPFKNRASATAWRGKYRNYVTGGPQPDFTLGVDTLPFRDRCLMAANAAAPPMTS